MYKNVIEIAVHQRLASRKGYTLTSMLMKLAKDAKPLRLGKLVV